jgi:hypothetical protein
MGSAPLGLAHCLARSPCDRGSVAAYRGIDPIPTWCSRPPAWRSRLTANNRGLLPHGPSHLRQSTMLAPHQSRLLAIGGRRSPGATSDRGSLCPRPGALAPRDRIASGSFSRICT